MSSKGQKNQNIQVFVRARPINATEKGRGSFSIVETSDHTVTVKERPQDKITKNFTFDRVFGPKSKQVDVYRKVVMPLLEQVLLGYNCTVFAYGQTGTGKTFTMEGERCESELPWDQDPGLGIIPRTLSQLFDELRIQGVEFTVRVSFLELYNEELFDLLGPETDTTRLRLYEDAQKKGSCIIHGLEEVTVHNKNDVYEILRLGSQKRQTAATLMNAHSSRSHTVFSVTVHIKENTVDGEELLKTGKLNLVDLAGSENVGRSGAVDRRAREAGNINQSLLTLGRVITSLVERAPHVPYRESKLTRLLQDSLGGRTKTSIIAAISPASCNLEETLSTLDYAQRAKNITNRPEVNQRLSKKTLMKEYTEEIERLRRDLLATREQTGVYLAPENYDNMVGRLEEQEKEIVEKVNHIRALQEDMEKKEALFSGLKTALEETEGKLCDTRYDLQKTKETLQLTETERDEQSHLVERRADTERRLAGQASQLLSAVKGAASDLRGVHDKLDRKRTLEQRNETVGRQFQDQFQADMRGLEAALEAAFETQRAFCTQEHDSLGADLEARKKETASLTSLLSELLGSQTEQLRELEVHAQSEAAGQHSWIGAQLEAVSARRQAQTDTQSELRRRLAAGAEAVLARLAQLDASAEQRQAELRRWLQQHDAGLRAVLDELAELVRRREQQARQEAEERAAALEAENKRLVERQAQQTAYIESISKMLAAGLNTAQQMATAAAEDAAASESALAARRAALERAGNTQTEFLASAGQSIERAQQQHAEDVAAAEKTFQQRDEEVVKQTAEARAEVTAARDSWAPPLDDLAAGAEQHWTQQEASLHSRRAAAAEAHRSAEGRIGQLAAAVDSSVGAGRQQLAEQQLRAAEQLQQRQQRATEQEARVAAESAALTETVRQRAADVQILLLESLERDVSTGNTPQRREFTYPRYLAATSPHERILQRYRTARAAQESRAQPDQIELPEFSTSELLETDTSQSSKEPATPESEGAPELPTPSREPALPTPSREPTPAAAESRLRAPSDAERLARAPSVSDVSDAGSDAENKCPDQRRDKAKDEFAVPAATARRQTRRALRQPKVHPSRQASQSPRRPAGVLTARND
ncbi:Kinesin-like protein KIF11 [Amphibalanus amphitrite]|uniref:Kinesin-like protein KIF11 n=1 Tax=Amphibalanus amphitrite TaxID=1232801 RepID=A0A6A4W7Q8_AMPAM|nr:Kinesin-like protein KIF11 [Amphibalanus amphitrite]